MTCSGGVSGSNSGITAESTTSPIETSNQSLLFTSSALDGANLSPNLDFSAALPFSEMEGSCKGRDAVVVDDSSDSSSELSFSMFEGSSSNGRDVVVVEDSLVVVIVVVDSSASMLSSSEL